jgi:hypothetical protein
MQFATTHVLDDVYVEDEAFDMEQDSRAASKTVVNWYFI